MLMRLSAELIRDWLESKAHYANEMHQFFSFSQSEYDFIESGLLVSGPGHNVLILA